MKQLTVTQTHPGSDNSSDHSKMTYETPILERHGCWTHHTQQFGSLPVDPPRIPIGDNWLGLED